MIIILLILIGYQTSKRVNWDLSTKKYSVATRYEDIKRASSLSGETELGLIERLNKSGNNLVLFRTDLAVKQGFVPPDLLDELKKKGITRAVAVSNLQLAGEKEYRQILDYLSEIGPKFVVLRGLRAVDLPFYLTNWLKQNNTILGTVEFRNRETTEKLVSEQGLDWVRLHRVFNKEVGTLTPAEKRARYSRAIQERNIGVIEYRLPLNQNLDTTIDTLNAIQAEMAKSGYRIGPIGAVRGTGNGVESSRWLVFGLIVASFGLVFPFLWPGQGSYSTLIFWILASIVGGTMGLTLYPTLTRQASSLILAVTAPLVGYKLLREYGLSFRPDRSLMSPFLDLIWMSALSTIGGLAVSSTLLDESFLLKLQQFRGVKVALFLPLILLVFATLSRDGISFSELKFNYRSGLLGAALLGLFLFLLFRSGNFTFLRSGDLENAIRRWLENTLYVRPRFKEFALGHPSLIAWLYLAGRYGKKFHLCKIALLLLGFIGQISIINTFSHIHSPLIMSLIRTGNGLAGGIILGGIILAVILGGEYVWNLRKG
ncbi:hypothetical protein KGY79_01590 [Candidatus Bipolaricaulota bacterium]|nr:hypothetical protein [Candidatus Bipolaricaulota bacterium]